MEMSGVNKSVNPGVGRIRGNIMSGVYKRVSLEAEPREILGLGSGMYKKEIFSGKRQDYHHGCIK